MTFSNRAILHIPHSSTDFPHTKGFLVNEVELTSEVRKLTDWYTDELFEHSEMILVKAEFSRLFCDVERFSRDEQEPMAKLGMGMCYETFDDGHPMRRVTEELREEIFQQFYLPHHQKLRTCVEQQLQSHGYALIVDGHSFTARPFQRDPHQQTPRPHFNIGTSVFHTPASLIEASVTYLQELGYTVGVDWPYSGTMVPLSFYEKKSEVHSIMVEVNRNLYLQPETSQKSDGFHQCRQVVQGLLEVLMETSEKSIL